MDGGQGGGVRLVQPQEVARLALFLAADDSSAITGQTLLIDAGRV